MSPVAVAAFGWLGLLFASPAAAQVPASTCGTYRYLYPHNTEQLAENHFIVLECGAEGLRGWYYGTSDDFDRGREGYLPGFFVAQMQELEVLNDSIRFMIAVGEDEYFATPVPLALRSAEETRAAEVEAWRHRFGAGSRHFRGTIDSASIILEVDGSERIFDRLESAVHLDIAPPRGADMAGWDGRT